MPSHYLNHCFIANSKPGNNMTCIWDTPHCFVLVLIQIVDFHVLTWFPIHDSSPDWVYFIILDKYIADRLGLGKQGLFVKCLLWFIYVTYCPLALEYTSTKFGKWSICATSKSFLQVVATVVRVIGHKNIWFPGTNILFFFTSPCLFTIQGRWAENWVKSALRCGCGAVGWHILMC